MFIHTNLTAAQVRDAFKAAGLAARGLYLDTTERGSRSHARKVDVRLYALDARPEYRATRKVMAGDDYAATWGEWGVFLGYVFSADPEASATYYSDAEDFHAQTHNLFRVEEFNRASITVAANLTTDDRRKIVTALLAA